QCLDRVLSRCQNLHIDLNISMDGFEQTHEKIRGVPGCFRKTMDALRSLPPLVKKYRSQLRVNMNTCVNADNLEEVIEFMKFVFHELPLDGQYLQVIRGNPLDPLLKRMPPDKLKEVYDFARLLYEKYAERMFQESGLLTRTAAKIFYA